MPRSTSELVREASEVGRNASNHSISDNEAIQVLAVLIEELAENMQSLERDN